MVGIYKCSPYGSLWLCGSGTTLHFCWYYWNASTLQSISISAHRPKNNEACEAKVILIIRNGQSNLSRHLCAQWLFDRNCLEAPVWFPSNTWFVGPTRVCQQSASRSAQHILHGSPICQTCIWNYIVDIMHFIADNIAAGDRLFYSSTF